MRRRLPALILVIAVIAAVAVWFRDTPPRRVATFSVAAQGWMPAAPANPGLIESWFCPGVPATGVDGVDGRIVVANRVQRQLTGTVLLYNEQHDSIRLDLVIEPFATATVDLAERLPGEAVGAVVEIEGGGALVEQQSTQPRGDSWAACPNATSDTWYLADGYTVEGSIDQLVLSNPFEQTVVVDLVFATEAGYHAPAPYQGLTVQPRSVRLIDMGAPGAGAQSEPVLAVSVEASRGRLVVGRSQQFTGGGRSGAQVTVAVPSTRGQWWFANGVNDGQSSETYVLYNPTNDPVEADVLFVGIDVPVVAEPLTVPAREAITFDTATVVGLPSGYAAVVASSDGTESLVVERVRTTRGEDAATTGVISGATVRQDGYAPTTWFVPAGPAGPVAQGLVVHNVDNSPGTVTVSAIGRSGPVVIEGLDAVEYGAAQRIVLDLTDPLIAGRQLLIEATTHVMIERSFPSGIGDLRTPSWAIPAG